MIDCLKLEFYHGSGISIVVVDCEGYQVAEDIKWLLNQIDRSDLLNDWLLIEIPDFFEVQPKYISILPV